MSSWPAARLEAIEAQDWYEREAQGLGARFRRELDRVSFSLAIVDGDSPGASLQRTQQALRTDAAR